MKLKEEFITKMLNEVFGENIRKRDTSLAPSSTSASLASPSASTSGSNDTKVDQDYVKQYTAFLKHILERAKNDVAIDEAKKLLNTENGVNADILHTVEKLLNTGKEANGSVESTVTLDGAVVAKANKDKNIDREENGVNADILHTVEKLLNTGKEANGSVESTVTTGPLDGAVVAKANKDKNIDREENGVNADTKTTEKEKTSSCGDANVCIENINNKGNTTNTTIYKTTGTGKKRDIVETILE